MAEAARLGEAARGRTAPNPNVGCVIVGATAQLVASGATAPGGRPHAEAVALAAAGEARARRDALHHARTLRPRQRARPDLRRADRRRPGSRASSSRVEDPDPRTAGQGIAMLRAGGRRRSTCVDERRGARQPVGLSHPPRARPPAHHPQAGPVDRRQDRASVGRIEMDHRRGCARPRPPRARPQRHDPRRPRHLSRRLAKPRRPPARARGMVAAPRPADPRRGGRGLGNPVVSAGCVPPS